MDHAAKTARAIESTTLNTKGTKRMSEKNDLHVFAIYESKEDTSKVVFDCELTARDENVRLRPDINGIDGYRCVGLYSASDSISIQPDAAGGYAIKDLNAKALRDGGGIKQLWPVEPVEKE